MNERKSVAEMMADLLREAALLTVVFIPLDRIVSEGKPFTQGWFWTTLLISGFLLTGGLVIERIR